METKPSAKTTTNGTNSDEDDNYVEYIPVAKCRAMEAQKLLPHRRGGTSRQILPIRHGGEPPPSDSDRPRHAESKPSLLVKSSQLKLAQPKISPTEQLVQQQVEMIDLFSNRRTLMSVRDLAKGITYTEPLATGWSSPSTIRHLPRNPPTPSASSGTSSSRARRRRCAPIKNFKDMGFPKLVPKKLKAKGVFQPTPIHA
ncbi:hypothetical protein MRB53_005476 [Persea americana]|uniref:Uncharacterized protein n=1 Tax=Persea americana TaxID=3435 RepID=A0ACC2ME51_PERAE|nr:hypothetical protein MRB53_005476 [Persea americana]